MITFDLIFATTLSAEVLLGASLLIPLLAQSAVRVWPPPSRASWQFWAVWTLTVISSLGVALVGLLDWNTAALDHWLRLPIGAVFVVGGLGFAMWGITTLGRHATLGLEGTLIETGPYRWTRNPQYVGDIAALLGWAIVCNSASAWLVSVLGAAWFALAPFAEEPWLRAQYGEAYDAYRRRRPRFLGNSLKNGERD